MTTHPLWRAEDVLRAVHGQHLHEQSWRAQNVAIDSRTVQKGDLFVALKGPSFDAHNYVAAAFAAGATAAIVSQQPAQVPAGSPLIFVEDTFTALEHLGQAGRARAEASIVAVTGSVGKTSSKEMLRLMLTASGSTYANEGSLNNQWGVPLSLARLPATSRFGVFELGMNHAGELETLSRMVRPHVALITNIEAVHLEFFASLDSIADAKAEIFQGLQPKGTVILNRDNVQFSRLASAAKAQGIKNILSFGTNNKAEARLLDYTATPEGSEIKAEILGHKIHYRLGALGEHLALNSLGALLATILTGGDREACAAALASYQQPKGRGLIQTVHLTNGDITLIDESYNASPAAVRAAIRVLGQRTGRRILALGDMRELGTSAPALHADLAKEITEAKIDLVFCCGDMMKHLYEALPPALRGGYAQNSTELAPQITNTLQAGDTLTVKGSHSMEMEKVVEAIKKLETNHQTGQIAHVV